LHNNLPILFYNQQLRDRGLASPTLIMHFYLTPTSTAVRAGNERYAFKCMQFLICTKC